MADLLQIVPLIGLVLIILGLLWIILRLIGSLDRALERQQGVTSPAPVPQPVPVDAPPKPAAVTAAAPAKPPVPSGPFAAAPAWFAWALHEVGFHETGNNQGIDRYIGLAHAGSPGDPWCAIFANAALESSGVPGTRSASSQSFRSNANFVQLTAPALGAIAVYWRGAKDSGLGHVGFYRGEDATRVWTLGGNENDMVQIEALPKSSATFGLIGYWWPKGVPLPTGGPIMMPAGSPVSVQVPPTSDPAPGATAGAIQKGIVATMFGGQQSAYGGAIDDNAPGVALPFGFKGVRPKVRVTNPKTGASVDCAIVDVGPWLEDDDYWDTGARPLAEMSAQNHTPLTRGPNKGKIANGAGIDLTFAAAKAIAIDGKGIVEWSFITASPTPTVT